MHWRSLLWPQWALAERVLLLLPSVLLRRHVWEGLGGLQCVSTGMVQAAASAAAGFREVHINIFLRNGIVRLNIAPVRKKKTCTVLYRSIYKKYHFSGKNLLCLRLKDNNCPMREHLVIDFLLELTKRGAVWKKNYEIHHTHHSLSVTS